MAALHSDGLGVYLFVGNSLHPCCVVSIFRRKGLCKELPLPNQVTIPSYYRPNLQAPVTEAMLAVGSAAQLEFCTRAAAVEVLLTLAERAPAIMRKCPAVAEGLLPLTLTLACEVTTMSAGGSEHTLLFHRVSQSLILVRGLCSSWTKSLRVANTVLCTLYRQ